MAVDVRRTGSVLILGVILLLGTLAAGQVTQERTHRIQQSGSGAPVVSVTSGDRAVSSERVARQDDTARIVRTDAPSRDTRISDAVVVRADDRQRRAVEQRSPRRGGPAGEQIRELPQDSPYRENILRRMIEGPTPSDRSVDRTTRDRRVVESNRDDRNIVVVDGQRAGRDSPYREELLRDTERRRTVDTSQRRQRIGQRQVRSRTDTRSQATRTDSAEELRFSQRARVTGEDASLIQQIIVSIDRAVSDRTASRTRVRSRSDLRGEGASRQDVAVRTRGSDDTRVTVRERRTGDGDRVIVDRGGRRIGDTDCIQHTHRHGNGGHHGEFHIGAHTHTHVHCPR